MTAEAEVVKKGIELTEKAIEGVGNNLAKEGNKYKELLKYTSRNSKTNNFNWTEFC